MPTLSEMLIEGEKRRRRKKKGVGAGELLEQLTVKKLFKPGREEYWRYMQSTGMESQDIVDAIFKDQKNNIANPKDISAAQEKATLQTQTGQNLLDVLSQGLQQQAQGAQPPSTMPRQNIQQAPSTMPQQNIQQQMPSALQQQTVLPMQDEWRQDIQLPAALQQQTVLPMQGEWFLSPQQQGIRGLMQADPRSATFETMQKSFPQRFSPPPDPLTPSERMTQEELGILKGVKGKERKEIAAFPSLKPHKPLSPYEERRLKLSERRQKSLEESRRIGLIREKRLSLADDRRYEIAVERLGLATADLDLDNRKYLVELAKIDEASDYRAIKAILEQAKAIAPGQGMTNDLLGQAIERLKIMDTRFDKTHKRAVKRVKSWFFWEKPTLRGVKEIDQYGDLF